jgi:hypothetical protein
MTPEQFRERTTESDEKRKQYDPKRPLDQEILAAIGAASAVKDATVLHPGTMFPPVWPLWRKRATIAWLTRSLRSARSENRRSGYLLGLPDRYVAAKFYFSESFPATDEKPGVRDRHPPADQRAGPGWSCSAPGCASTITRTFRSAVGPNVRVVDTSDVPQAKPGASDGHHPRRSRDSSGTYGGFAYLAPFYGVRSVSFFSRRSFESHHLELANRVFDRLLPAASSRSTRERSIPWSRRSIAGRDRTPTITSQPARDPSRSSAELVRIVPRTAARLDPAAVGAPGSSLSLNGWLAAAAGRDDHLGIRIPRRHHRQAAHDAAIPAAPPVARPFRPPALARAARRTETLRPPPPTSQVTDR